MPLDGLTRLPDLATAYEDQHVTIVESARAASRASFAIAARSVASADGAMEPIRADPAAIAGVVQVEAPSDALRAVPNTVPVTTDGVVQLPVPLAESQPNVVRATFDAPSPGVFVLKDSFYPGWSATLDARSVDVVRVDGMVRGVIVPTPGQHEVIMRYRPLSFMAGLVMSAAAALALVGLVAWDVLRRVSSAKRVRPEPDRLAV
jgi:hypothetical protein